MELVLYLGSVPILLKYSYWITYIGKYVYKIITVGRGAIKIY